MGLSDNMVPQKSINMVLLSSSPQNRHSAVFPMFWQTRMRKWARNNIESWEMLQATKKLGAFSMEELGPSKICMLDEIWCSTTKHGMSNPTPRKLRYGIV